MTTLMYVYTGILIKLGHTWLLYMSDIFREFQFFRYYIPPNIEERGFIVYCIKTNESKLNMPFDYIIFDLL